MKDEKYQRFFARDIDMWVNDKHGEGSLGFKIRRHLHHEKTQYQTIDVVESVDFGNMLFIDGSIMLTDRDEYMYHEMIVHVPINCHPDPKKALIIGGGDGGALRELCRYKSLEEIVLVEIDERVIEVSKKFFPDLSSSFDDPRIRLMIQDGVSYMDQRPGTYDIIITDSTDPYGPGEGLFQTGYYQTVFNALAENGILAAQTESAFYDLKAVEDIYKNLSEVFPFVTLYWAQVPTYPGGGWTFCLCSRNPDLNPHSVVTPEESIEKMGLKYYNRAIHKGAFYLPRFILEAVKTSLSWTAE
jgi:spermidine synthase